MNINISKELVAILASLATILFFLYLLFGKIGALRADGNNIKAEQVQIRQQTE